MSEEPKLSKVTRAGNQSAEITDKSVDDFYFRDWLYIGDESLAHHITNEEGAYIVVGIGDRETIDGGATPIAPSSPSGTPTATTQVIRSSSNNQTSIN
jgi:hypothetical protein